MSSSLLAPLAPFVLFVGCALSTGCALTSKGTPIDIRWFSVDVDTTTSAREEDANGAPKLAVGRITSSDFLRNKIVFRKSSHEVATYEELRWTEYPEEYLRRSLVHALFEKGRFVQALDSRVPTLDVELVAFEEVLRGGSRTGHVQMAYRLRDDQIVLAAGVIDVDREASGEDVAAVVAAIAAALDEATARVAAAVDAQLSAPETTAREGSLLSPRRLRRSGPGHSSRPRAMQR